MCSCQRSSIVELASPAAWQNNCGCKAKNEVVATQLWTRVAAWWHGACRTSTVSGVAGSARHGSNNGRASKQLSMSSSSWNQLRVGACWACPVLGCGWCGRAMPVTREHRMQHAPLTSPSPTKAEAAMATQLLTVNLGLPLLASLPGPH